MQIAYADSIFSICYGHFTITILYEHCIGGLEYYD